MDLRRLRYFVVLARELHYGRAARRLNIAQPGLSQQIRALERELGVRLLHRNTHGVSLTEPGAVLLREGDALLRQADDVVAGVRASAQGLTGRLRLVHTRSAADLGPHAIVQEFRNRFPRVDVTTEVAWTSRNVEMLRAGEVDAAFVRPPLYETPDLHVLIIGSEELVLALPAGHPLCKRRRIRRTDVRAEPVIQWPRRQGPGYYDLIKDQIWGKAPRRIVVEEPDAEHILAAVASGIGVAALDFAHAAKLRPGTVTLRRFTAPVPRSQLGIAWQKGHHGPVLRRFIDLCAEYHA